FAPGRRRRSRCPGPAPYGRLSASPYWRRRGAGLAACQGPGSRARPHEGFEGRDSGGPSGGGGSPGEDRRSGPYRHSRSRPRAANCQGGGARGDSRSPAAHQPGVAGYRRRSEKDGRSSTGATGKLRACCTSLPSPLERSEGRLEPTRRCSCPQKEPSLDWSIFDLPLTDPRHPFHVHHMEMALEEAAAADDADEVAVGAVIVSLEKGVIARAHNQREQLRDPTAHAEMIAITQAAQALGSWRLEQCVLYVTLEPCPMCAGAVVLARLPLLVYGTTDPKAGACHTLYQITADPRLSLPAHAVRGVLAGPCAPLVMS